MRDPKRIETVMEKVREYWLTYPDLRFFQMIECLKSDMGLEGDQFYLEDHVLLGGCPTDKKKPPSVWCKEFGLTIHDPDGWRVDNKDYDDPITEADFRKRAEESTCVGDMSYFRK